MRFNWWSGSRDLFSRRRVSRVPWFHAPKTSRAAGQRQHHNDTTQSQPNMSSLLDSILNSDAAAPTPSSDAGNTRRPQQIRSSSARPRGPPSESAGANSDAEGFPDDEVVGRVPGRRVNGPRADIPKVVDVTGETLSLRFQEFLERYVYPDASALQHPILMILQLHGRPDFFSLTSNQRSFDRQVLHCPDQGPQTIRPLHTLCRLYTSAEA